MSKMNHYLGFENIIEVSQQLRKRGKSICFTHGAFNSFSYSHLYFLQESSKLCDFLIVAVDSDKNLDLYKQYTGDLCNESHRYNLINAIRFVDIAYINNLPATDDVYEFIYREIKPDCISIGMNFHFEKVVEERTKRIGIHLNKISHNIHP